MNWSDLVPQAYYDVIARLTGGSTVLIAAYVALAACGIYLPSPSTIYQFLAFVVIGYATALVHEGWLDSGVARKVFKFDSMSCWNSCRRAFNTAFKRDDATRSPPDEAVAIDSIRLVNPGTGSRLVKLRAESKLSRTLCLTFAVQGTALAIVSARESLPSGWQFGSWHPESVFSIVSLSLMYFVVSFSMWRLYSYLADRHYTGLYSHWLLLIDPAEDRVKANTAQQLHAPDR